MPAFPPAPPVPASPCLTAVDIESLAAWAEAVEEWRDAVLACPYVKRG